MTRTESESSPLKDADVARAAADTVRKAHAVGLAPESPAFADLTYPAVRRVVWQVREAGIAEYAARALERADPADTRTIATSLREIEALLDDSPLPATEWRRLLEVLGREPLARLLGIGVSSVNRYERSERQTPDAVAARLHFLALVTGDLAGAYNDIGVRRWFDRKRSALGGRSPAHLLKGRWQPEDEGPQQVRALARALVSSPAT
jgi:hypothetical protein